MADVLDELPTSEFILYFANHKDSDWDSCCRTVWF